MRAFILILLTTTLHTFKHFQLFLVKHSMKGKCEGLHSVAPLGSSTLLP